MRKFSEIDASRFLKAAELILNHRYTVTIIAVTEEEIGLERKVMIVLALADAAGRVWKDCRIVESVRQVGIDYNRSLSAS